MSHMLSAEFYALSQRSELWLHDVGIFEYDTTGLRYEHLAISGQKHPAIVRAGMQDLSSFLSGKELEEDDGTDRDAAFLAALGASSGESHISTFYLVGEGFRDIGEGSSWMKRSLQELCSKRRHVFVGQNFYVKGACYNSYYMAIPQARPEFVAADTELTTEEVFLYISQHGKMARLTLIPLQTAWFTAEGVAAVLPDGAQELLIGVQNAITGETRRYPIALEGLPERPPKTTKLLVRAEYSQQRQLHVSVQDLGFGDLFPASEKTWEQEFVLDEEEEAGAAKVLPGKSTGRVLETVLPGSCSPLQIPRTGWKVYAFDELCWYVKENISALDRGFFDDRLFSWLDELTGNSRFSDSLRRAKEEGRPMSDLVRLLFGASDYISPAEQKEAAAALAVLEKQDASARAGMVGDYYYRYGRYMSAALQYQHAIWLSEHDEQAITTRGFRSGLWHNMGLALLRLGDRDSALQCLQRAFQEKEDMTLIRECLSILYMNGEEKVLREMAEKYLIPEETLSEVREACDQTGMDYESSRRAARLEEMLAQPGGEAIAEYLEEVKKRYAI
jgi:tetratricopeptide (TPR) repeat protein